MKNIYRYILEQTNEGTIDKKSAAEIIKMLKKSVPQNQDKDIAIVGIAVDLPMSETLDEYWDVLSNSVNCIREFPEERKKDIDNYLLYTDLVGDEINYTKGGYLNSIDKFDYDLFKLTPKEGELMEPCQRIFLQTAYKAIEDSGYGGNKLEGSNTGVYVGFANTLKDCYQKLIFDVDKESVSQSIASNLGAIIPNRVSYSLNLSGPSMVVDTACSSSLVAVHLACKAILSGECEQAIAGGIKLHTVPIGAEFIKMGIESSDGYTRSFDDSSDGAGIGEASIAIFLKPLKKAMKDKDNIYAVIKGSAVNQDGSSMGITAPNPISQAKVISKSWQDAGVDPNNIQHIVTHGTGTTLGDPIEIEGLSRAFNQYTNKKQFCSISSVKPNIGHTYECSGLASLVCGVLLLKNKTILPSLHFEKPNKKIDFCNSAVYVNTKRRRWQNKSNNRLCGISSFGFGGTNCHLVLEESPEIQNSNSVDDINLLTISAETEKSLLESIKKYFNFLNEKNYSNIHNICYTANTTRGQYAYRFAVMFKEFNELKEKLKLFIDSKGKETLGLYFAKHKIVMSKYEDLENNMISLEKKVAISDRAKLFIEGLDSNYTKNLMELCELYIKGADIDWSKMYLQSDNRIVSIPTYQFDLKRCWINIPQSYNNTDSVGYYNIEWSKNENYKIIERNYKNDAVIIIKNKDNIHSEKISDELKRKDIPLIEVEIADKYKQLDGNSYLINNSQEDYELVLEDFVNFDSVKILYMNDFSNSDEYNHEYERLINFYYLLKSLYVLDNTHISLDVILNNINSVNENERCNPINRAIQGLIKVIAIENDEIDIRIIDVDKKTDRYNEILKDSNNAWVSYRNNERYVPFLDEVEFNKKNEEEVLFKDNGVYLISGGLGDITLEIMKNISLKEKVNFILLTRTKFPSRNSWNNEEYWNVNDITSKRIREIQGIEKNGCSISIYKCDVAIKEDVEKTIKEVLEIHGEINGIIHAAGVAGNKLFMSEKIDSFKNVIDSKIKGAWNLDCYTKGCNLDFFTCFSSIASIMPAPGQSSYVAANSFLDAFSISRNSEGKRSNVINWATWGEVGMAKRVNMNVDTMFKTLETAEGVEVFNNVLKYNISRALVGKINNSKKYQRVWENLNFEVSDKIKKHLTFDMKNKINVKNEQKINDSYKRKNVELLGRKDGVYSDIEKELGNILARLLGFSEIYVYDNLFEMGIDSIIMVKVVNEILKVWSVDIELTRFIEGASIEKLALEIDQLLLEKKSIDINIEPTSEESKFKEFNLTEVQSAYFMGRKEIFDIGNVSTHAYVEIETLLDIERLNRAISKVIEKHDMLRAVINENGKQLILKEVPDYKIECVDLRHEENYMQLVEDERSKISHRMFDITTWPLFKFKAFQITDVKKILSIDFDMLIADAMSLQIILQDIMKYYENEYLEAEILNYSFDKYVKNYFKIKSSDLYLKDKEYWLDKLEEFPTAPSLKLKKSPKDIENPHFKSVMYQLSMEEWTRLKDIAKSQGVTVSNLICAAYSEVLSYWSNQKRLAINLATFNRYPFHDDVEKLVGDFTSVVLLDVELDGKKNIFKNALSIQNKLMEALNHRHYEGVEFLREIINYRQLGTSAVMPIVFTSMIYREDTDSYNLLGEKIYRISQTSQVYIDCQVTNSVEGLSVLWDYVDELFDEEIINEMFNNFVSILLEIANNSKINMPKISEKDKSVVMEYNDREQYFPENTLVNLFNEQSDINVNKIAVKFKNDSITYEELDKMSNKVARYLIDNGIEKGDYVGVLVKRCIETIVNILGILKAGGVYVPIEPEYPEERKRFIIKNSAVKRQLDYLSFENENIFRYSDERLDEISSAKDEAYVIYTSGSTGVPKGVVISHGEVVNTILDINSKFNVTCEDKIIGISSMCFDLSVYDIFGSLSSGATLVMVADQRDIKDLMAIVREEEITVWNSVPSIIELCVNSLRDDQKIYSLKTILLSGDWIPLNIVDKIKYNFVDSKVISLGGATEGSIWSIYYPINSIKEEWKSIPYGVPLANQSFYVLNYNQELCPLGVEGELYIGGKGVAEGYLNNEELTNNAFIMHKEFGRIYKTGDYGIMHNTEEGGLIEFCGRKDFQVKINGYRVELGEIEKCILKNKNIEKAIVIDLLDDNKNKYLCAYLISGEKINIEELKKELKKELPNYMVPLHFMFIDEVPLTTNGKVDRKKLVRPESNLSLKEEHVKPRNKIESKLVDIFRDVLSLDEVGVKDDFYELGISSIFMIQLVDKIEEEFDDIELKFKEVLEQNDISELAVLLLEKFENLENISGDIANKSDKLVYWSPVKQWKARSEVITIGGKVYSGLNVKNLTHIYSIAQDGVTIEDILNDDYLKQDNLEEVVHEMIKDKVLIKSVLSHNDIFKEIKTHFENEYKDEYFLDYQRTEDFKISKLNRTLKMNFDNTIMLDNSYKYPQVIENRRSIRRFDESRKISFYDFGKMISIFKQKIIDNKVKYYYASAGGLYPIDVYIFVKENRVESLEKGLYYYSPIDNTLKVINSNLDINDKSYYYSNKGIFNSSAFSIYMIYDSSVNMPKYKSQGYIYAALDAGIMISKLTTAAEYVGCGVCSIGDMKFDEIEEDFYLSDDQVWLHTIEVGLKFE